MRSAIQAATALSILFLAPAFLSAQCPAYTHKDDVIVGSPVDLPGGFVVYKHGGVNGIYTSDLYPFSETVIPNTSSYNAAWFDISEDGQWIVFGTWNAGNGVYLIRRDGTQRTQVPNATVDNSCGFWKNGPNGTEVWWVENGNAGGHPAVWMKAIQVTLGAGTPSFGATRTFASFNKDADSTVWDMHVIGLDYAVAADQILGVWAVRTDQQGPSDFPHYQRTCHLTIPNNGLGESGVDNMFVWTDDTYGDLYGCGHTMTYDGTLALANSNAIGSACVPNTKNDPDMDHKGFYITPFRHDYDPPMALAEHVDVYGTSINWCPENFRLGEYDDVNFTNWAFSNANDYVVGVVYGDSVATWSLTNGIWVVNYPTNTWTMLNSPTTTITYEEPALYFPGGASVGTETGRVHSGSTARTALSCVMSRGAVAVPDNAARLTVFDMHGRTVWRASTIGERTIALPRRLRRSAVVIMFEQEYEL